MHRWNRIQVAAAASVLAAALASGCHERTSDAVGSEIRLSAVSNETGAAAPMVDSNLPPGSAELALDAASRSGRYLFIFLWKDDDLATQALRQVFQSFAKDEASRTDSVDICVTAVAQKRFVDTYGLATAPMPLALAFAPNGSVTGAFPTDFSKDSLLAGFVSPRTADVMKLLQEGKLVMLCVQNASTATNDEALTGAKEFSQDERFRAATELVMLDPSDAAEAGFLKDLQIPPETSVAVTVLLAPPGSPVAKFEGATTKDLFVEALSKASSGCPGGQCGPGGCGPSS